MAGKRLGGKRVLKKVKSKAKKKKIVRKISAKASGTTRKKAPPKKTAKKVAKKISRKPAAKAVSTSASGSGGPKSYKLRAGDKAPGFVLAATSGRTVHLADFLGKKVVLYFYPKDNTPGCTLEGQDFARLAHQFRSENCEVLGVSQDSIKSHEKFKQSCSFNFDLLSDERGDVCRAFDVIQMKNMYGKKFEGIERGTFVIDEGGWVRGEWRKVKVDGHAQEVLDFVRGKSEA